MQSSSLDRQAARGSPIPASHRTARTFGNADRRHSVRYQVDTGHAALRLLQQRAIRRQRALFVKHAKQSTRDMMAGSSSCWLHRES